MRKDGSFKGNPLYFGRKDGGLVDVIEKMNKQNPKPEIKTVMDYKEDKEEYQKVFQAAMKKFGVKSPADFKDEKKKKEFFDYVDKNYTAEKEAIDMKAKMQNKKLKDAEGEEEPKGKKMGNVVVHGETARPFFDPNNMKEALAKVWEKSLNKEGGPGSGPQPGAGTRSGSAPDGGQTDREADDYEDQIASQKKHMKKKKKNEKKEVEVDEKLDDKDKPDIKDVVKGLKKAIKTHTQQAKSLTKQMKD